jgi:hypothetical protein
MVNVFEVGAYYSNEEIYKSLGVGNAGGVRTTLSPNGDVRRLVVMTAVESARAKSENPYHDRLEGDVLIYTGAGKSGDQSLSGGSARIAHQIEEKFPIYGFVLTGSRRDASRGNKRWAFLGLLEFLRCYRDKQLDSRGQPRSVWMFEMRVHPSPAKVAKDFDAELTSGILGDRKARLPIEDRDVVNPATSQEPQAYDYAALELVRSSLLAYDSKRFEHVISHLLVQTGFQDVEVTKYSQDGGIDVNARPGPTCWPVRHLLLQVQAKRWVHTVGRKEVAELRGSLQPHSAGCIITTSHFSRAALTEAQAIGKTAIGLVEGYELADLIKVLKLTLP